MIIISFGVSPTAATFYFYKSFWSVLGSQALETPQLIFRELNEPDLAWLLQPSPEPSPQPCWTWPGSAPKPPGAFSGTFSRTLLNRTWLCTKASQTFSGTFSWLCTKASALHQVFLEPCWTWPGSAPKPPGAFSVTFSRTLLTWTRPGSAPKPPEPSLEPCWTWPGSAPKPPRPSLEHSPEPSPEPCWTWPALHQSLPDLLRNLLRNLVEPDPAPAPVHTGAILGWRPP